MTDLPQPIDASRPTRAPLILFAIALVAWMSGLAVLTQLEAPVVVNQFQVRRADMLILGTLDDRDGKRIRVEDVLLGEKPGTETMEVSNLDKVRIEPRTTYILPMWRDGRIVKVSNPRDPGSGGPVIYPDSEDAREQILDAMERGVIRE